MAISSGSIVSICLFIFSIVLIIWGVSLLRRKTTPKEIRNNNIDEELRVLFNMHIEPVDKNDREITYGTTAKITVTGEGVLENISLYIVAIDPNAERGMVWDEKKILVDNIQGGYRREITTNLIVPINSTVSFRGKLTADGINPLIVKTDNAIAGVE